MATERSLIVCAHAGRESFGRALSETYANAAEHAGQSVRRVYLEDLQFDPVLRAGFRRGQALEPALEAAQEDLRWASKLVFSYPVWWGSVPANLKGFLDRVFLPGFAFKYEKGDTWPQQLLAGRRAQLLITMDTPPWYFRWIYRAPAIMQMKKTTLEFCGVKPVSVATFGSVIQSNAQQRARWLQQVAALGARA